MADGKQGKSDRIGRPDPDSEPTPPRVGDAGDLGVVGERKLEEDQAKDEIWRRRPATPDERPADPAARGPAPLPADPKAR